MKTVALIAMAAALAGIVILSKKNMKPTKTSQAGINAIKTREGFSARMYLDTAGKPTIGYGHLIKQGEKFDVITLRDGEKLLEQDLQIAELAIEKLVKKEISQGQYDALASFIFNVGVKAFRESTMLEKINKEDYVGAKLEFARWVKVTDPISGKKIKDVGLVARREKESAQFA